eukprot:14131617-Alexandrium_andersonii.AAC.1
MRRRSRAASGRSCWVGLPSPANLSCKDGKAVGMRLTRTPYFSAAGRPWRGPFPPSTPGAWRN